mmetsp:Transcript_33548/g.92659  ORF Transcript_33548/g.92659 Transcript_33548/m.92659 type:complete len:89 (+) Transcript_33548:2-268(+)
MGSVIGSHDGVIRKTKGVRNVFDGRAVQGVVKPNEEGMFLPKHTTPNACTGKTFSLEIDDNGQQDATTFFETCNVLAMYAATPAMSSP